MNFGDILVLAVVLFAAALALRSVRRQKKRGGCCGDCARCGRNCQ
ncbi:MAG: FeoB-associated Cys-rich membrane protein [Oscillospiraceae bacterium]|nr:FeoB-associated Cys-rich membrane protein [Oscillospiraceae bacterium]